MLLHKRTPALQEKFTHEEIAALTPIKLFRTDTEDQSDFAFFSVLSGLKWYLCAPTDQEGFHQQDPAWFKQPGERWHPHLPRVVEMCHMMQWQASAKLFQVSQGKFDTIAEDEISRAVRHMVKHKEIPIWVQFAAQTYIDIQDVLGDRLDAPLKELQVYLQTFNRTLANFLSGNSMLDKYEKNTRFRTGYLKIIDDLKRKQSILEAWFTKDPFTLSLRGNPHPYLSKFKKEDHVLLRRHPLGCGVLQYNMFEDLHEYGLQLELATDCIRPMIYLYAATRLLCEDSPTWPDMELLILRQDPQRLLYGKERPMDYRTIFTCFEQATVMPLASLHITDPSMLTDVFMDRFDHQVSDNKEVDSVVSRWTTLMRSEEGMKHLLRQRNVDPSEYSTALRSLQEQAKNNKPDGILTRLLPCLEADAIDLHFDWLSLHNTCALLWIKMYSKLSSHKGSLTFDPDKYRMTPESRVRLVAQILRETVEAYNVTQNMELKDAWQAFGDGIRTAASTLQETIKTPSISTMYGQIMGGDFCIALTMGQTTQQGVHYPGIFYKQPGPMNVSNLYRGWDKKILKSLHSITCAEFSDAKHKDFMAQAEDERRRQQEILRELLLAQEPPQQKKHDQSSKAQKAAKKSKNQKKKGKGTTF